MTPTGCPKSPFDAGLLVGAPAGIGIAHPPPRCEMRISLVLQRSASAHPGNVLQLYALEWKECENRHHDTSHPT